MNASRLRKMYLLFVALLVLVGIGFVCWTGYEQNIRNAVPLKGNGTQQDPYIIETSDDYKRFAESVNEGLTYDDKFVCLKADIDYSQVNTIVGDLGNDTTFAGTFDGNGYKILHANVEAQYGYAGLFNNLSGMVCNLTIEDGYIEGEYAGAIAGSSKNAGKILNCHNKAIVVGSTKNGVASTKFKGDIFNCLSYAYDEEGNPELWFIRAVGEVSTPKKRDFTEEEVENCVSYFNHALDTISTYNEYNSWCIWVHEGKVIELTQRKENVLCNMTAKVNVKNNVMTLRGYSGENDAWYFAIPAGYVRADMPIELNFIDGTVIQKTMPSDKDEMEIECNGRTYTIMRKVNSDVASVFISTDHPQSINYLNHSKLNLLPGNISILGLDGTIEYKGILESIAGRGNDSWNEAIKKGYNIILKDPADLFGMGVNEDFAFLPGYRDNSLLAYRVLQDFEKVIGVPYSPEMRFVNLYIDNLYMGMFLISETNEVDINRVDITNIALKTQALNTRKLYSYKRKYLEVDGIEGKRVCYDIPYNPEDVTGGYLIELDREDFEEEQSRFKSNRDIMITLKGNKYATEKQVNYIAEYWQEFEDALFSESGYNAQGKYYADYIDMESFADQWLTYELNSEPSTWGSIYYYKESDVDGDGLLHASYAWDVEHSYVENTEILYLAATQKKVFQNYWGVLYQHEDFAKKVYEEWNKKFVPAIEMFLQEEIEDNELGIYSIDQYEEMYKVPGAINQTRWPSNVWGEKGTAMKEFLTEKEKFLNTVLGWYDMGYDYFEVMDGILYGARFVSPESEDAECIEIMPYQ